MASDDLPASNRPSVSQPGATIGRVAARRDVPSLPRDISGDLDSEGPSSMDVKSDVLRPPLVKGKDLREIVADGQQVVALKSFGGPGTEKTEQRPSSLPVMKDNV